MTVHNPAHRVEELRKLIRDHDTRYYSENNPEISDYEYDQLVTELKILLEQNPSLKSADCPTERVGSDLTQEFAKVNHASPMLSIDNSYDESDVLAFHERVRKELERDDIEYTVEAKIDGVASSLLYNNGRFILGKTL